METRPSENPKPAEMGGRLPLPDLERWQQDAQHLWDQGQKQEAINRLLERINGAQPQVPRLPGLQLSYYVFLLGDHAGAELFLSRLLEAYPDDPEILENLGVMLSRQSKDEDAIAALRKALELQPDSINAWDGLAACFSRSGRYEEARQAGEQSLARKTAAARPLPHWQPPAETPQQYLNRAGTTPRLDVVAFSIWGSNPRYLRGALRNALLIPELYPGWTARFYLDDSVPAEFRQLLQEVGADCRLMPTDQSLRQKLCWRFLVANDPTVGRFLVRDCDSVVSQREVAAVQQWLDSECWFHVMRDWWTHTDPMLAGMWGGIAGILPDLQALLTSYTPAARETPNVDQWFLRDVLWGSIHPLALVHDRCYRSKGSQPWPGPIPEGSRHVGENEFVTLNAVQAAWLAGWIQQYPCLQMDRESADATRPPTQGWRTLDLRTIPTRWISLEKDSESSLRMQTMLAQAGFQDAQWSPGVSIQANGPVNRERLHAAGVALAHRQALLAHSGNSPLLILEDDVALEADAHLSFAVPEDADAVWVGISRYGRPQIEPISTELSRIRRMFSAHAVLYLSTTYRQHVVECVEHCLDCNLPFDIATAFHQQDYRVYALNKPIFYQADHYGGAHPFEALTRGPLLPNA